MEDESDNSNREPEALPGPALFYNEAVIDHFMHSRNVGELPEAETDGVGLVGDPSCGDQLQLWIAVCDARIAFKSFDCPGAIATSSTLTALAEGKSIEDARRVTDDDVIEAQGTIRVSLGRETREEDIDTTVRALMETVARLRQISSVRGTAE